MKFTGASYKRVKNIGNYESEHLELFAEVGTNENVEEVVASLKKKVATLLGIVEKTQTTSDELEGF